jgi:hypothetical protein
MNNLCVTLHNIQQEENAFHQQIEFKFREETNEMPHLEHSFFMVLKFGKTGK